MLAIGLGLSGSDAGGVQLIVCMREPCPPADPVVQLTKPLLKQLTPTQPALSVDDAPNGLTPVLFPGGELPQPETPSQRRLIQAVACVALAASIAYLVWRVGFTLGASLWIAIPLLILEFHATVGLGLFAISLWNVDDHVVPEPVERTELRVGLLIPTYNEPKEILFPTIAAAVALRPAHETYVLDDGSRHWVRELAESLGAVYMARTERTHAKAGNLNHALTQLDLDIVAVLDADHVAREGFLTHTLRYFDDPRVAVVQTPQDFYNQQSFEHGRNRSWFVPNRRRIPFNEQRLFYRAIQPGKNRWQGAFWCGTNAVLRVSALRDVGGIACETLTEDMHTTIRLHRRKWRSIYHNEVLAYGLAARDATEYQAQRLRWGTGAMQILRLEHPLTGPGLTFAQRLAYATTLLGWFDAWRTLGYVLLPLAVLFSGAVPIHASAAVFLPAFVITFAIQRLAMALLSRGNAPQGMAALFEFVRMESNIRATLSYFRHRERSFGVTVKGASAQRRRVQAPRSLWILVSLTAVALVWFCCTLAGVTPVAYRLTWAAYGAAFWALVNLAFLIAALARIRGQRFASERRSSVRLHVGASATLAGQPCELVDVSIGGAMVRCEHPPQPVDTSVALTIRHGADQIVVRSHERGRQLVGDGSELVRLEFMPGQVTQLASLATAVFGSVAASEAAEPAALAA